MKLRTLAVTTAICAGGLFAVYNTNAPAQIEPNREPAVAATRPSDGNKKWTCLRRAFPVKPYNFHDEPLRFSPDNSRVALKAWSRAAQGDMGSSQVIVNGKDGKKYDGVGSVVFSPDSTHFAYGAKLKDKCYLVVDDQEGPALDGEIGQIVFSPDSQRLAYTAGDFLSEKVIVDGKQVGLDSHSIEVYSLAFSPDSHHVAYATGNAVFLDGKSVSAFDELKTFSLKFLPDSSGLAFSFRRGGQHFISFGGKDFGPFDDTGPIFLKISPDAKRFACPIKKAGQWFLFADGQSVGPYQFEPHPLFSPDSKRLAHVGCETKGSASVFLDGRKLGAFDGEYLFSPDGKQFVYTLGSQKQMSLYRDERLIATGRSINQVRFSPDSQRLAWVINDDGKASLVQDGKPGPKYDFIRSPSFSPDSRHLAYAAREGNFGILVIDGDTVTRLRLADWGELHFTEEGRLRASAIELLAELKAEPSSLESLIEATKSMQIVLLEVGPKE